MTAFPSNFKDYTTADWENLFGDLNLFHCLTILKNPTQDTLLSTKQALIYDKSGPYGFVNPNTAGPEAEASFSFVNIHPPSLKIHSQTEVNEFVTKYSESGYTTISANLGVPGIASANLKTKNSYSHDQTFAKTTFYFTEAVQVAVIKIEFDTSKFRINDLLEQAFAKAVAHKNVNDRYYAIVDILEEWGHYFVNELYLGGLIYQTINKDVTSWSEADSEAESVSASFSANLAALDIPVEGGGGVDTGSCSTTSTSGSHSLSSFNLRALGGKVADTFNYHDWASSLSDPKYWAVCNTPKLTPIINFISDQSVRYAVANTINEFQSVYPDISTSYIETIMQQEAGGLGD